MRGRVPYDAERSRLLDGLRAAFSEGPFHRAYPGVRPPDAVTIGGDASEPAFEVVVWPMPQSVRNTHRTTTCPLITSEFDIVVGVIASGATEREASEAVLAYVDCVYQTCMADPTLGGLVDHVHPTPDTGGVGTDGTYGYTAGANVRVACRRDIRPNRAIARAIRDMDRQEV